jgi:hypothetical protein
VPRFIDNLDAVVNSIGTQDVGLVWGLATTPWENEVDRDAFLDAITNPMDE